MEGRSFGCVVTAMKSAGSIPDDHSDPGGASAPPGGRAPLFRARLSAPVGLTLFGLAVIATVWTAVVSQTRYEKQLAVANVVQQNSNLAIAFEQYVTRTLQGADTVTRYVEREYLRTGTPFGIARFLGNQAIDPQLFAAVSIVDEHGNVISSNSSLIPHALNIARMEQFLVHIRGDRGRLFIGKPLAMQRVPRPMIVMTRRITRADGSFGGVVAVLLDPERLTDFYRTASVHERDVFSLTGLDGIVRARRIGQGERSGEDLSGSRLLAERALRPVGSYYAASKLDNVPRFFSYRTLPDYPLVATVGMSEEDALAGFHQRRKLRYGNASLASLLIALFTALLVSSLARQRRATTTLARSEARLLSSFDAAAIGIVHASLDGRHLFVNRKFCEMLGYTRAELLALAIRDVVYEEDAGQGLHDRERLIAGEQATYEAEQRCRCKDGSLLWVNRSVSIVRDAEGRPLHFIGAMADISQRKAAEAALRSSEERYRHIVETAQEGIWLIDEQGCTRFANPKMEQMLGCDRGEMLGRTIYEFMDDKARQKAELGMKRRSEGIVEQQEVRFRRKDGSELWAVLATSPIDAPSGAFAGALAMVTEITERKRQEEKIARLSRIQRVLSGINSVIVRVRSRQELFEESCRIALEHGGFEMAWVGLLDHQTLEVRTAAHVGIEPELLRHLKLSARADLPSGQGPTGRALRERKASFNNDMQSQPHPGPLRAQIAARGYHSTISLPLLEGGEPIGVLALFARVRDFFDSEEVSLLSELAADISFALEFIDREEKLNYLALYDVLTRLPNRTLFFDRLSQALAQAKRDARLAGIMFIDLDRFKTINDTYGHGVGDDLLRLVGERLRESVRESDTVARLGGDEFAIALSGLATPDDANLVAQKTIAALARPFDLDGRETYMTASIGLALYPLDAEHAEELLKNADTAMYRAKEQGRNSYRFYRPSMNERASEQLQLETQLRGALRRQEFVLHFQPKISVPDGRISGFEALLRWRHPERGLVLPNEFIATLEDTGMIVPVGEWVMRSVCEQILAWKRAGLEPQPVAVNLSARQFQHERLDTLIGSLLRSSGINPRLLEFELTESLLMSDAEEAARTLRALKAYGVGLSVDDFGTGYSSLAYLKRFPLDVLKIDRAFIRDITSDSDDAAITRAIITLAHSLKLKVVAEGVETREQAQFLQSLACDELQGFYFGEPRMPEEFALYLRAGAAAIRVA